MKICGLFFFIVLFSGCQVGPAYQPPCTYSPDEWKHKASSEASQESFCNWWEVFDDETLNALEQQAKENNQNIFIALERVMEARALAGVALANLYPQISLMPSYSNQAILSKLFRAPQSTALPATPVPPPFLREHQITNALPLNLTYELDLWGMLRSNYQSASYFAESQEETLKATLLILTADVADSYFRIRTLDATIELYLTTIETRKEALKINQSRYDSKITDYSSVSRAALDLTNVEADYFEAMRQREIEEDRLAVLIGMAASDFNVEVAPLRGAPPQIPAGIPSDVLLNRPDIAAAERNRASEQATIRVAYAAFFPAFSITGALGFSSPDLKHFLSWKSRYWAIGGLINQSIFDGGQRSSTLELAVANFRQADDAYKQQVLVAFQEVEDALVNIERYFEESIKLEQSVESSTTTYQISRDRYLQGVTFYLDVVDSERDMLNAERNLLTVKGLRYSATIQLIKAIGGSW